MQRLVSSRLAAATMKPCLPAALIASFAVLAPPCSAQQPCGAEGAFGLAFGAHAPADATRDEGGDASITYLTAVPKPDDRFDVYRARVDTATGEIFEVSASRTLLRMPGDGEPDPTHAQVVEAQARGVDFARAFVAALPQADRERLVQEHGGPTWTLRVADGVDMTMSAGQTWDATLSCKNFAREWKIARRVLPELFNKDKPAR